MASYPGTYRDNASACSAGDTAFTTANNLKRRSRALNITRLAQLGHLAPRFLSHFIDLTESEGDLGEAMMAVSEEDMLEAKDPDIKDTDEWPSFDLRKVNVVSMKNGQIMSLLDAHQDNPVKVSGQLETIDKEKLFLGTSLTHSRWSWLTLLLQSKMQNTS